MEEAEGPWDLEAVAAAKVLFCSGDAPNPSSAYRPRAGLRPTPGESPA